LPAAAIIKHPLRKAAAPAAVYADETGLWLPSDMEIT
jgi:hypothetical protein